MEKMKLKVLLRFAERVREERGKQGISQEALAVKAGVHRTYVGMIERAEKNLTLSNIERIAKALRLSIAELRKRV